MSWGACSACQTSQSTRKVRVLVYWGFTSTQHLTISGRVPTCDCTHVDFIVWTHGRVKPVTYKIDICRFLTWCLALLRYGKDWLAQCQDNMTEWDITSWCWWPSFPVEQHYKVVSSHKSVPILIWHSMLLGHKTTSKQKYSAAPLWDQAPAQRPWYSIQSHYSDIEQTSLCPILI